MWRKPSPWLGAAGPGRAREAARPGASSFTGSWSYEGRSLRSITMSLLLGGPELHAQYLVGPDGQQHPVSVRFRGAKRILVQVYRLRTGVGRQEAEAARNRFVRRIVHSGDDAVAAVRRLERREDERVRLDLQQRRACRQAAAAAAAADGAQGPREGVGLAGG